MAEPEYFNANAGLKLFFLNNTSWFENLSQCPIAIVWTHFIRVILEEMSCYIILRTPPPPKLP